MDICNGGQKLLAKLQKNGLVRHKQCKTLLKYDMVRLKIISLYIYKDLKDLES